MISVKTLNNKVSTINNKINHAFEGVKFDNTSMFSTTAWTSGSPKSWNHTITGGTNRLLIVYIFNASLTNISSVTYSGTTMILGKQETFFGTLRHTCYYLKNPNVGTGQITVTISNNTGNSSFSAASYNGVNQTNPVDTVVMAIQPTNYPTSSTTKSYTGYTYSSGSTSWMVGCIPYNSSVSAMTWIGAKRRGTKNSANGAELYDSDGIISTGNYYYYGTSPVAQQGVLIGISINSV